MYSYNGFIIDCGMTFILHVPQNWASKVKALEESIGNLKNFADRQNSTIQVKPMFWTSRFAFKVLTWTHFKENIISNTSIVQASRQ